VESCLGVKTEWSRKVTLPYKNEGNTAARKTIHGYSHRVTAAAAMMNKQQVGTETEANEKLRPAWTGSPAPARDVLNGTQPGME